MGIVERVLNRNPTPKIIDRSTLGIVGIKEGQQVACEDCKAWAWTGKPIRHSSRCSATDETPPVSKAAKTRPMSRAAWISQMSDDERRAAVDEHRISVSEAMNRDD